MSYQQAMIAADWWSEQLGDYLELNDQTRAQLRLCLTYRIRDLRARKVELNYVTSLKVEWDYHPDLLLALALDDAGIDVHFGLPSGPYKRWSIIEDGLVVVSTGYAGERVAIYGTESSAGLAVDRVEPWEVSP